MNNNMCIEIKNNNIYQFFNIVEHINRILNNKLINIQFLKIGKHLFFSRKRNK